MMFWRQPFFAAPKLNMLSCYHHSTSTGESAPFPENEAKLGVMLSENEAKLGLVFSENEAIHM